MNLPDAGAIAVIAGALGAFGTGIATLANQYWQFKLATQRADFEAAERLRVAEELKNHNAETTAMLARNTQNVAANLSQKIDVTRAELKENTEINVKALDVANNVNEKILAIGGVRMRAEENKQAVTDQLNRKVDHIQEVGDDTHQIVSDMKEKTHD